MDKLKQYSFALALCMFLFCMIISYLFFVCVLVVQQERAHQSLLNGVEHFDKSSMKHAETQEKNPLPDPAGRI